MQLIYQNFDQLEVSFQCTVPQYLRKSLEEAKRTAQQAKQKTLLRIGPKQIPVMVFETGARGGFSYQFSTGHDGEIWLIAENDIPEYWNIRVRVKSLCLALNGYKKTKEKILRFLLEDLHAKGPENNGYMPKERVSRFDYCLDFLFTEEFYPDCKNFICHGRTKKMAAGNIYYNQSSRGQKVETITIGKMPNRQVTIYNKTKEISVSQKAYWWKLWGIKKEETPNTIWRVEIRAGKKELNKWNLRTFANFEDMAGDVISHILREYRYTQPNQDKNQSRWPMHDIWFQALEYTEINLLEFSSNASRKEILEEIREGIISRYKKMHEGICIGLTAALGMDISEIPGVLDLVSGELLEQVANNPQKFTKKFEIKENQFSQLK